MLCLQQTQAEKALAKKLTISKSMLSDQTKKRLTNMARQENNLQRQRRAANNTKQKVALNRAEVNVAKRRKNLDERVRVELSQVQAKKGNPKGKQPASGRQGLGPAHTVHRTILLIDF